jgi:CRP-like cAMP-binding protein
MQEELISFLSQFKELTSTETKELANLMTVKHVPKNTLIVKPGQTCNLCYFVLKGCLRQFVSNNGVEKTTAFYTEQEAINFLADQPKPATSFLASVEDSILLIGQPAQDQHIYEKFPSLAIITRRMIEADLFKTKATLAKFITSSPKERYLNLLEQRPDLLQRAPQHMIAGYLGMTPESLSRIRRRVVQKRQPK